MPLLDEDTAKLIIAYALSFTLIVLAVGGAFLPRVQPSYPTLFILAALAGGLLGVDRYLGGGKAK